VVVDDQISSDYVESLLNAAQQTDADLVVCDHLLMRNPDGSVRASGLSSIPANREYLVPKEHVDYEYYRHNVGDAPIDQSYVVFWSKLYRRDLVERALPWLREEDVPIIYNEDVLYAGVFLHLASRTTFTHQGTYVYGSNTESAMRLDFMERLHKIAADQLEVLFFLQRFLMRSGADSKLMDLFQAWKAGNWGFLEMRYAYYRTQVMRNL
jgi:GT2 family glycosyltransferase